MTTEKFDFVKIPLLFMWYAVVGLASVVFAWFSVDFVHVCWQVSFSNAGKIIDPALITGIVPNDKAGWILIAAGVILAIQIGRARDKFIEDLAKAIARHSA